MAVLTKKSTRRYALVGHKILLLRMTDALRGGMGCRRAPAWLRGAPSAGTANSPHGSL
jgi:hypothetical protein